MPKAYFTPKMLTFFRQLEKNNKREWFTPRKEIFQEHVYNPMIELVTDLCEDLRRFAVDLVPQEPKKVLYRIYRDTRFSKDKTPYKVHLGAHFQHRQLPKNRAAGMYVAVSHKELDIAGGIYMPDPDGLLTVRRAIEKQPAKFRKLVEDKKLIKAFGKVQGEAAKRVPAPFSLDTPMADWIKMKQLYFYISLPAGDALKPSLRKVIADRFLLLQPFVAFFNDALLSSLKSAEDERPKRPEPMF